MRKYKKREKISITKYDPVFRNKLGHYQKDEWTAMSDIGKVYDGKVFTYEDYIETEEKYLKAVFLLMDYFNSKEILIKHIFKLKNMNKVKRFKDRKLYNQMSLFNINDSINVMDKIESIVKLRLREYIGELEIVIDKKSRTEILFGFDYYMYINTNKDITKVYDEINKIGLFIY